MPANSADNIVHIGETLKSSLKNKGTIDSQLVSSSKRILLSHIGFQPAGQPYALQQETLKAKYIPLNSIKKSGSDHELHFGRCNISLWFCNDYWNFNWNVHNIYTSACLKNVITIFDINPIYLKILWRNNYLSRESSYSESNMTLTTIFDVVFKELFVYCNSYAASKSISW